MDYYYSLFYFLLTGLYAGYRQWLDVDEGRPFVIYRLFFGQLRQTKQVQFKSPVQLSSFLG